MITLVLLSAAAVVAAAAIMDMRLSRRTVKVVTYAEYEVKRSAVLYRLTKEV